MYHVGTPSDQEGHPSVGEVIFLIGEPSIKFVQGSLWAWAGSARQYIFQGLKRLSYVVNQNNDFEEKYTKNRINITF